MTTDNRDELLAMAARVAALEDAAKVAETKDGIAQPAYWRGRKDAAADIRAAIAALNTRAPVGEVVALEKAAQWFERADDQAAEGLCDAITAKALEQKAAGKFGVQPYFDMVATTLRSLATPKPESGETSNLQKTQIAPESGGDGVTSADKMSLIDDFMLEEIFKDNPDLPHRLDDFDGDTPHLVDCIDALLDLDDAKALVPHGLGKGSHAYRLLCAARHRLAHSAGRGEGHE